jgi:WD40 repeat protein/serine/threonine protein kinase
VLHEDSPKYVGRFRVIRELGRGGFGVVFLAFDPRIGRNVALKVPRPEVLLGPSSRRRFLREAEAAGALEHPNLIPIYEVGEQGLVCYIASAYCAGPNLARWLTERSEPVPMRSAAQLMSTLARGVEHAHRRGVLHRDIKPANVLLEATSEQPFMVEDLSSWTPRLTDFGLAKVLEITEDETRTGNLLGTPAYMAPEQAEGRLADVGPATDVYALGVVLYELVTGRAPFRGQSDVQTLQQVSRGEPLRPSRFRQGLSRDLEAIILKCLARDPARRYASAFDLAKDLDRFLSGEPTLARPSSLIEKTAKWMRRRPAVASLLAVVALAMFSLAGGGWWYSGQLRVALDESRAYESEAREEAAEVLKHELTTRRFLHVANVNLAERALATSNVRQARELLARDVPGKDEPDLRGFAWHYLHRRLNEEELTLRGHTADVYCVCFAPNGRLLATASQDRTARVWDRVSGECLSVLTGHVDDVNCVAFSADSKLLASASDDGTVRIWDLATCEVLQTLAAHEKGVCGVAFSPDGSKLATGGRDKNVRLWATSNWQQVALLEGHNDAVGTLAFSRAGDILVTGGDDRTVRIWDVATGQLKLTHGNFGSAVSAAAVSRDGQQILSAGRQDHTVRVWKTASGVGLKVHEGFSEWIHAVLFLDHDRQFVVGSKDGEVSIIDVKTSKVIRKLSGHAECVWSVALSPDERHLATASADRTVKIWDLIAGASHEKFSCPSVGFPKLALTRDGQFLATGGDNGRITIWDVASRRICWDDADLNNPTIGIGALAISPREELLAVSHYGEAEVQLWDIRSRVRVGVLPTQSGEVDALAFAPDGRTLAVGRSDGEIAFWDTKTCEPLSHISLDGLRFMRLVYSPNGEQLAISGEGAAITVWDVAGHRELTTLHDEAPGDVLSLSFSPDAALIAATGTSRVINLWDLASKRKVATLTGHTGHVQSLTFSPDGRCLASGGSDGSIKLWDLATRQELYTLRDRFDCASASAFHPDGRQLIATCDGPGGSSLHFWSTEPPAATTIDEPVRIGPEIRVNQTDDVSNSYPGGTLASNSNGSFVVAWHTTEDPNRVRVHGLLLLDG